MNRWYSIPEWSIIVAAGEPVESLAPGIVSSDLPDVMVEEKWLLPEPASETDLDRWGYDPDEIDDPKDVPVLTARRGVQIYETNMKFMIDDRIACFHQLVVREPHAYLIQFATDYEIDGLFHERIVWVDALEAIPIEQEIPTGKRTDEMEGTDETGNGNGENAGNEPG